MEEAEKHKLVTTHLLTKRLKPNSKISLEQLKRQGGWVLLNVDHETLPDCYRRAGRKNAAIREKDFRKFSGEIDCKQEPYEGTIKTLYNWSDLESKFGEPELEGEYFPPNDNSFNNENDDLHGIILSLVEWHKEYMRKIEKI